MRAAEPAGQDVAGIVYTVQEQRAIEEAREAETATASEEDDGSERSGWLWALGGLVLLGLTL